MMHLNLYPFFINIISLLSVLFPSSVKSLAVPLDTLPLIETSFTIPQKEAYSRKQKPSEKPTTEYIRPAMFDHGRSLLLTIPSHSYRPTHSTPTIPPRPHVFSTIHLPDPPVSAVRVAPNSRTKKPWVWKTGEYQLPGMNVTVSLHPGASVLYYPWNDPKFDPFSSTTETPTLESISSSSTSTVRTDPYYIRVSQSSTRPAPTGMYLISAAPPALEIDFTKPTVIPSKTIPSFDSSTHSIWGNTVPWFTTRKPDETPLYLGIPKWTDKPPPTVTGVTIQPHLIPTCLISTFLGDLGWARTKGYVIPVDSNGVTGWHKVVATGVAMIGTESIGPNQVQGGMDVPDFPNRSQAPIVTMNSAILPNSVDPALGSNTTYNDALKIAAIQAFAQIGVILLAVIIIISAALLFVCCSSILKWPMKIIHALRFRDMEMFKDAMIPTKLRRRKEHKGKKKDRTEFLGYVIGNSGTAGTEMRYLRGTAEAVMCGAVESSNEGSSATMSAESFGRVTSGSTTLTTSVSVGTGVEGARDENMSPVASVTTGSQSRAEGGRLRARDQNCERVG